MSLIAWLGGRAGLGLCFPGCSGEYTGWEGTRQAAPLGGGPTEHSAGDAPFLDSPAAVEECSEKGCLALSLLELLGFNLTFVFLASLLVLIQVRLRSPPQSFLSNTGGMPRLLPSCYTFCFKDFAGAKKSSLAARSGLTSV